MNIATIILVIFGLAILGGAVMLIIIGMRDRTSNDDLQQRLAEFAERGQQATLEEIELSQPLTERVIFPLARRLGELVSRFTPQNALQSTARKLELAGNPRGLEPATFWALRIILAVAIAGFLLFIFSVGSMQWTLSRKVLIMATFVGLGFYVPEMLITSRIQRRQKVVRKAMPDALDLLTICVEAGLGFDGAMQKVSDKWDNELSWAFARVIREIQLGKLRREALRDMADRIGISEMTSFVAAIIQSEQLGVSMAKVLRIQADQMRIRRRQLAEEQAHQAPVKMLIPMALLIFPSICIILMTPSILMMFRSTLGGVLFGGGQ
jgi:tight adherence protein C